MGELINFLDLNTVLAFRAINRYTLLTGLIGMQQGRL